MEEIDEEKLKFLFNIKGVVGYSKKLQNKIVGGKETKIKAIRIYVEKKVPKTSLLAQDLIPAEINGIPTDVVEIGKITTQLSNNFDPKARNRPITGGISIGNVKITAGTLGYFFQNDKGEVFIGSNAHVLTDDPFSDKPSAVEIVQPGVADGGKLPDDLVGNYVFHVKLKEGTEEYNKIDFAVSSILVDYDVSLWYEKKPKKFIGLLFAGSDTITVVCKAKYIVQQGYSPVGAEVYEVKVNDGVQKWGRNGYNKGYVVDDSAVVKVYYTEEKFAVFDDQILTTKISSPGDSGSSVWFLEEAPPERPYPLTKTKKVIKGYIWFIPIKLEMEEEEENEV